MELVARSDEATQDGCDVLVLDTEPRSSALWKQALTLADQVLVVVTAGGAPLETVLATEVILEDCLTAEGRPPATYLINRFDGRRQGDRSALAMLRTRLGTRVLPFTMQEDAAVRRAQAEGQLLAQSSAGSQVVADFNAIADWVIGRRREGISGARLA